ncbi:MAG: hypothetical protein ACREFQ_18835, partial [Stellaceae bacterium]
MRERRHRRVNPLLMARAERKIATLLGQEIGDRPADPARRAGDDRFFAFQVKIHDPAPDRQPRRQHSAIAFPPASGETGRCILWRIAMALTNERVAW